ncbi:bleomycin hydrolase, partial [Coemansia sp. RSA 25]
MTVHHLGKHNTTPVTCSSYARHYLTKHDQAQPDSMIAAMDRQHEPTKVLTTAQLSGYRQVFNTFRILLSEFDSDIKNKLATLTISRESYTNALENREVFLEHPPVFSHKLAIDAPITNQMSSGRCWLFAGLNMLRQKMMKDSRSQNILATLDEDLDGRVVQYLLKDPIGDGGQWDMFVALIEKYGVVPKEAYPETFHTSSSGQMDGLVTSRLR